MWLTTQQQHATNCQKSSGIYDISHLTTRYIEMKKLEHWEMNYTLTYKLPENAYGYLNYMINEKYVCSYFTPGPSRRSATGFDGMHTRWGFENQMIRERDCKCEHFSITWLLDRSNISDNIFIVFFHLFRYLSVSTFSSSCWRLFLSNIQVINKTDGVSDDDQDSLWQSIESAP